MDHPFLASLWGFLSIAFFIFTNAFFVISEFALVSVRRTRIAELASQGHPAAEAAHKALENPERMIAATQLGVTLSSLALGWIGEPALSRLFAPVLPLIPVAWREGVSRGLSAGLAFATITFLTVVIGELAPKSIALQDPERASLTVARPILFFERLFQPAIWLLNGAANVLLRLIRVQPAPTSQLVHSIEELRMLLDASTEGGVVEEEESEMVQAIFDLGELVVRQVMVPRTEVVAVRADTPLDEIIRQVIDSSFTKFPIYEENLDQIVGIVHIRDLLKAIRSPECQACIARDIAREPLFVPETLTVSEVLRLFRDKRQHIAIVLDEFGGTAGLVTLQDLLEEIVGEVNDQFDVSTPGFQTLPDGSVLIDGLTLIEEVNDQLDLNLREDYYDTIAGYVMGRLGRIPRLHDVVEADGVRLQVEEMDRLRVARVKLTRLDNLPNRPPTKNETHPLA